MSGRAESSQAQDTFHMTRAAHVVRHEANADMVNIMTRAFVPCKQGIKAFVSHLLRRADELIDVL